MQPARSSRCSWRDVRKRGGPLGAAGMMLAMPLARCQQSSRRSWHEARCSKTSRCSWHDVRNPCDAAGTMFAIEATLWMQLARCSRCNCRILAAGTMFANEAIIGCSWPDARHAAGTMFEIEACLPLPARQRSTSEQITNGSAPGTCATGFINAAIGIASSVLDSASFGGC